MRHRRPRAVSGLLARLPPAATDEKQRQPSSSRSSHGEGRGDGDQASLSLKESPELRIDADEGERDAP